MLTRACVLQGANRLICHKHFKQMAAGNNATTPPTQNNV